MPRKLAFDVLKRLNEDKQYSNIAVNSAIEKSNLSAEDKSLAHVIVMGVIERSLTPDYIINKLAKRKVEIASNVRILLRIGLFQIIYLDRIPVYAAVNETVSIAPKKYAGFVNAMLRAYIREGKVAFPSEDDDLLYALSVKYSFPLELCKKFTDIYGVKRTKNIFDIFNATPKLTLRINTLKISPEQYIELLEKQNIPYRLDRYCPYTVVIEGKGYSSLPGIEEGYFFVQDAASQICSEVLGAKSGERILDACACPGGKSFSTAILMENKGRIFSCDLHSNRLGLIETGANRLGIDIIETFSIDGRSHNTSWDEVFDKVLCDVPCSGLGVIGKKPEIRYKSLSDFEKLPSVQYDILENCSEYVKRGGVLVYSTCTIMEEENGNNIDRFLAGHKDYCVEDFCVCDLSSENGRLSLSPDIHGTDGFFICKMRRRED